MVDEFEQFDILQSPTDRRLTRTRLISSREITPRRGPPLHTQVEEYTRLRDDGDQSKPFVNVRLIIGDRDMRFPLSLAEALLDHLEYSIPLCRDAVRDLMHGRNMPVPNGHLNSDQDDQDDNGKHWSGK